METIIGISVVAGILLFGTAGWFINKRKWKKQKQERVASIPELTNEEMIIVNTVMGICAEEYKAIKESPPYVYVIRDINVPVNILNGKTWKEWRLPHEPTKKEYAGVWIPGISTIIINHDNKTLLNFGKVMCHEVLHAAGWKHGEYMVKKDMSYQDQMVKAINFLQ